MAFDGLVMSKIIAELNTEIIDSKVNKIYSPSKNDILFNLYNNGKTYNLLINLSSENCRICTTVSPKKTSSTPSNFCMLLRKHLTSSRIAKINTFGLERYLEIVFEDYSEGTGITIKKVFAEIMNRYSNIVLTDEKNIIIGSLKYTDQDIYSLPHSPKADLLQANSFEEFMNAINPQFSTDLASIISNSYTGISKSLIQHIIDTNNFNPKEISDENLKIIYDHLRRLSTEQPKNLYISDYIIGNKSDFAVEISSFPSQNSSMHLNNFIDKYYFEKETSEQFTNEKYRLEKAVSTALKKCKKKLENINNKLNDCESMDTYRINGELLNSNLYKLSDVHVKSVELENYYDNNNLITIPLDISISVKKNAEKYFKKYRKLKNALTIVSNQKDESLKELAYLESIAFSINIAKNEEELSQIWAEIQDTINTKTQKSTNKKKKTLKSKTPISYNLEKLEIDGYTIYIGKNNKQNEYLTLKFASRNDIWFHVQTLSGSHVVLKTNNLPLSDDIIYKCASLAKKYSKGANDLNVSVDYTLIKNIKKSPNGKPGMVIYNTCKTIIV